MSLLATAKRASIATRFCRLARWPSRRVRSYDLRSLRDDIDLSRSWLVPGALCFDVDANVGQKSEALLAAGARVVAFKPNPEPPRVGVQWRARGDSPRVSSQVSTSTRQATPTLTPEAGRTGTVDDSRPYAHRGHQRAFAMGRANARSLPERRATCSPRRNPSSSCTQSAASAHFCMAAATSSRSAGGTSSQ